MGVICIILIVIGCGLIFSNNGHWVGYTETGKKKAAEKNKESAIALLIGIGLIILAGILASQ